MSAPPPSQQWNQCLKHLAAELPPRSFKTWFEPTRLLRCDEEADEVVLHVGVPSSFFAEWWESHYRSLLRETTQQVFGSPARIQYVEDDGLAPSEPVTHAPMIQAGPPAPSKASEGGATGHGGAWIPTERASLPPMDYSQSGLKPEYTLQRYIEGDCNRLARSAAVAVSRAPGETSFNPLMIYGGVGLGKTHLVQAIGNAALKHRADARVLYVTSEQFTNQFVRSIRDNRSSSFSDYYRQIDLLIVDDVQFLAGKEKTQEEFFHVFNQLHQDGKQIVLCADRAPSEIAGIEDRLLSRFRWGLSVDVQPPDLETRIAILQAKAAREGVHLPGEIVNFVAERITDNIRNLEGALIRLIAHASLTKTAIDLQVARTLLRDVIGSVDPSVDVADIQKAVAAHYDLQPDLLSGRSRKRQIVTARHVAMFLSREYTPHSLSRIGLRFGGRDHSTVIHACNQVQNRLDTEESFVEELRELRSRLRAMRCAA